MYNVVYVETKLFGVIRTLLIKGIDWFLATDICRVLELTNTTVALKRVGNNMKQKIVLNNREVNLLTKEGVVMLCDVFSQSSSLSYDLRKWTKENYWLNDRTKGDDSMVSFVNTQKEERTPIEVALDIDETGHTTTKKLYAWLDLNPTHYSQWIKRNILENAFASTPNDYSHFGASENQGRGNFASDYLISASFAKKLCMTTKSKKGEEARNYFIKVEEMLSEKVKAEKEGKNTVMDEGAMTMFAQALGQLVESQNKIIDLLTSHQQNTPIPETVSAPAQDSFLNNSAESETPTPEAKPQMDARAIYYGTKSPYTYIMDARKYPVNATTISRDFGIDVRAFNTMLSMQGILCKPEGTSFWQPTEAFMNSGIMSKSVYTDHSKGTVSVSYRWTRVGNELIKDVMKKGYNLEPLCERI